MKRFTLLVLLTAMLLSAAGQQYFQFSRLDFCRKTYNPASMAIGKYCFEAANRQQWMGLQNAAGQSINPETRYLSFQIPLPTFSAGSIGLMVVADELGAEKNMNAKLSYAYAFRFRDLEIAAAARLSIWDKYFDFGRMNPIDIDDPLLYGGKDHADLSWNIDLGLFARYNQWFGGLSAVNISRSPTEFEQNTSVWHYKTAVYSQAGYVHNIKEGQDLEGSVLIRTDFASTQYDAQLRMINSGNRNWDYGINYRHQDAIGVFAGMGGAGGYFGMGYEMGLARKGLASFNSGSFEVYYRKCFTIKRPVIRGGHGDVRHL